MWRFLLPGAWGLVFKSPILELYDKLTGQPPRPTRAAAYVAENARDGDPQSVLDTLDRYAREERWLMSVGPEKGPLIQELAGRLPADANILELGAYCGYSSILLAASFGSEARITSIEISATSIASASANIEKAGLSEQVNFLHGPSSEVLAELEGSFNLVFLDHHKPLYLHDLQIIESRKLIHPGSIVVADNVGEIFGADDYLDYVRSCGRYISENRPATIEYTAIADAVEISVYQP